MQSREVRFSPFTPSAFQPVRKIILAFFNKFMLVIYQDNVKGIKEMAQPVAKFRDGLLNVTIWENEGGKVFFSIDLKRSYKDNADEWQETTSLDTNDLLKASRLLQLAYDEIVKLKQS